LRNFLVQRDRWGNADAFLKKKITNKPNNSQLKSHCKWYDILYENLKKQLYADTKKNTEKN
jgi:hypothetical protein